MTLSDGDALTDAITRRVVLEFDYEGHHRVVQPAAWGNHITTGNLLLRGYQVGGTSKSGNPPKWGFFYVGQISGLVLTGQTFEQDPPGYQRGDQHLGKIVAQL